MEYAEDIWFADNYELTSDHMGLLHLGENEPDAHIVLHNVKSVKLNILQTTHASPARGHVGSIRTTDCVA